jgi:hypothetical protein
MVLFTDPFNIVMEKTIRNIEIKPLYLRWLKGIQNGLREMKENIWRQKVRITVGIYFINSKITVHMLSFVRIVTDS